MITISPIEVLALKKLTLVAHALADTLSGYEAKTEMKVLVAVLNGVTLRADQAERDATFKGMDVDEQMSAYVGLYARLVAFREVLADIDAIEAL